MRHTPDHEPKRPGGSEARYSRTFIRSDKPLADIVYARYAEGHSLVTIGDAMDTSKQNISLQLSLALRYIREIILRDPEIQEFLRQAGFEEIQDNQDVYLLINRVRYHPRTGSDKHRRG